MATNPSLTATGRRLLRKWVPGLATTDCSGRLSALEQRVASLEHRTRHDLAAGLSTTIYGAGRPPRSITDAELSIYSQNGEDGILLYLVSLTGGGGRRFLEIGIGDGRECCCANLALNWGWTGAMVEADPVSAKSAEQFYADIAGVVVKQAFVTVENVNTIVAADHVDLLSIDIDGNDYWVWNALKASAGIVVAEYNASFGPEAAVTIPYDPSFMFREASSHRMYHGASVAALAKLAAQKDMALVGCDSQGVNAFFVSRPLLSDRLREVSVTEAWRPNSRRLRKYSQATQEAMLAGHPVEHV